jgi:hypothetical protein
MESPDQEQRCLPATGIYRCCRRGLVIAERSPADPAVRARRPIGCARHVACDEASRPYPTVLVVDEAAHEKRTKTPTTFLSRYDNNT